MIGKKVWVIPGGEIPSQSTGPAPQMVSQDRLSILNAGKDDTCCEIIIFYEDQEYLGPYEIEVKAQRVRRFRINDLIDPSAVLLDVPYSILIKSQQNVVVQFSKQDTSSGTHSLCGSIAYAHSAGVSDSR